VRPAGRAPRRRAAARARLVRQLRPERLDEPGPAVGGGHAAHAEHDPPGAHPLGRQDQLADAVAGRGQRRELARRQQGQPARLGRLDHRGPVEQRERGGDGCADRPAYLEFDPLVARRDRGGDGPVPAVGHRHRHDLAAEPARPARPPPGRRRRWRTGCP
jgi:hypothetical protein